MAFKKVEWDDLELPYIPNNRYNNETIASFMASGSIELLGVTHQAVDLYELMYVSDEIAQGLTMIQFQLTRMYQSGDNEPTISPFIYAYFTKDVSDMGITKGWLMMNLETEEVSQQAPQLFIDPDNWYIQTMLEDENYYTEEWDTSEGVQGNGFVPFYVFGQRINYNSDYTAEDYENIKAILKAIFVDSKIASYDSMTAYFNDLAKATQEYIGDSSTKIKLRNIPDVLKGGDDGVDYDTISEFLNGVAKAVQVLEGDNSTKIKAQMLPTRIRGLINGNS